MYAALAPSHRTTPVRRHTARHCLARYGDYPQPEIAADANQVTHDAEGQRLRWVRQRVTRIFFVSGKASKRSADIRVEKRSAFHKLLASELAFSANTGEKIDVLVGAQAEVTVRGAFQPDDSCK